MIGKKVMLKDGRECTILDKILCQTEAYDYAYYRQTGEKRNVSFVSENRYLARFDDSKIETISPFDILSVFG